MSESPLTDIFISWSKPRARAAADALAAFLRRVLMVDPFVSTGINKGVRWRDQIAERLENAAIGIVCVTRESLSSEWLHFEAGALSGKPCHVFLVDLRDGELRDPLAQFQYTKNDKQDVLTMFRAVNAQCEAPRHDDDLMALFEKLWPDFEEQLKRLPDPAPTARPNFDLEAIGTIAVETLEIVRGLRNVAGHPAPVKVRVVLPKTPDVDDREVVRALEQVGLRFVGAGSDDGELTSLFFEPHRAGVRTGPTMQALYSAIPNGLMVKRYRVDDTQTTYVIEKA